MIVDDLDEFIVLTKKIVSTTTTAPPIQTSSAANDANDKPDQVFVTSTADTSVTSVPTRDVTSPQMFETQNPMLTMDEGSGEMFGSGDGDDVTITTMLNHDVSDDVMTTEDFKHTTAGLETTFLSTTEDFSGDEDQTTLMTSPTYYLSTILDMTSASQTPASTQDDGVTFTDYLTGVSTSDYITTSSIDFTSDADGSGEVELTTVELSTSSTSLTLDLSTIEELATTSSTDSAVTSEEMSTATTDSQTTEAATTELPVTSEFHVSDVSTVQATTEG